MSHQVKRFWENINYLDGLRSDWVERIMVNDDNSLWFACWNGISFMMDKVC